MNETPVAGGAARKQTNVASSCAAVQAFGGILDADLLFAGRKEVLIQYDGQIYRLLVTKNRKLILNK